jgi:hypothetical protein
MGSDTIKRTIMGSDTIKIVSDGSTTPTGGINLLTMESDTIKYSSVGWGACGSAECDGTQSQMIDQPSAAAQGGTASVPPYELLIRRRVHVATYMDTCLSPQVHLRYNGENRTLTFQLSPGHLKSYLYVQFVNAI